MMEDRWRGWIEYGRRMEEGLAEDELKMTREWIDEWMDDEWIEKG